MWKGKNQVTDFIEQEVEPVLQKNAKLLENIDVELKV